MWLGHLGFSYVGLVFLLMLFIPNILWIRRKPAGYSGQQENAFFAACERIGQILTSFCALAFSDFNLRPWTPWSWWLAAAFALMVLYEMWWVRYFRGRRSQADFYRSFLGIPVAGASLPVLAFFLLGIYGKVIWMLIAAAILGVGHIGIHLQHRQDLERRG